MNVSKRILTKRSQVTSLKAKKESDKVSKTESEPKANMTDIANIMMEAYKRRMHDDTRPGLVQATMPNTPTFVLKGHILAQMKDIPFYGKDHEHAYKHIDEVNGIADYFNIPCETVLLRIFPIILKGATKHWLKALPPGTTTTRAQIREEFIQQFFPLSKVSKLKKAIENFEQNMGESLYEAWDRYKGFLKNCSKTI